MVSPALSCWLGQGLVVLQAPQAADTQKRNVGVPLTKIAQPCAGMDQNAVLPVFDEERQVLSSLKRPNQARPLGGR